jgi:N6-L-threonylcarbamoyladenine synthase
MRILAIESSCDETSISILENSRILSNIISSQYFHSKFGGVIPELASRAHLKTIGIIFQEALNEAKISVNQIDAIAVTNQPGLLGSLIVGTNFAKGLSIKYNLPVIPINHIEGHLYSGFIDEAEISFPLISLVVSGGHTALFYVTSFNEYEIVGLTRDDAAGEAFDKIAKFLGLDYPGGPIIDKLAKQGNPNKYNFPRSMINSGDFDFSFSGLKTSVKNFINKNYPNGLNSEEVCNIAASVQSAIVEVLVSKTLSAAAQFNVKSIIVAGGVSANSQLKREMTEKGENLGFKVKFPEIKLSMDNAAMIGFLAQQKIEELNSNKFRDLTFTAEANSLRSKKRK